MRIFEKTVLSVAAAFVLAAQAAAQPIVLKLASPAPPRGYVNAGVLAPWAQAVGEASEGTLKIETFFGGTLGNFAVTYDRVVDGVADIGFILTAFAGGKFKQHDVAALPFEAKSALAASTALWNLYEKGVTAAEYDAVRPLAIWTFPNAALHSKTLIRTLEDFKGKKVVASNLITGKIVVALGGAMVALRPDEAYQAITRGVAEGVLTPFTGMVAFKIHEVTKHHLDAALGGDSALLFINRKRYESLPQKAKQAIDKFSYLQLSERLGGRTDSEWLDSRNVVKASVVALSPEQEAAWKKRLAPIAVEWAKETPNGVKVLNAYRAEIGAYEAKNR